MLNDQKLQDNGFKETDLEIDSLENIFRTAQKDFSEWSDLDDRKICNFTKKLQKFEKLTDALIAARTRKLIEGEFCGNEFPEKDDLINEYITPEKLGDLKSFDDILNALRINLTAYCPSIHQRPESEKAPFWKNPKQREKFLVK